MPGRCKQAVGVEAETVSGKVWNGNGVAGGEPLRGGGPPGWLPGWGELLVLDPASAARVEGGEQGNNRVLPPRHATLHHESRSLRGDGAGWGRAQAASSLYVCLAARGLGSFGI